MMSDTCGYCAVTGRKDIGNWRFYMVYNLWRVACIRQGVYARSLDGTASNRLAGESGKLVRPNAVQAWALAEQMMKTG